MMRVKGASTMGTSNGGMRVHRAQDSASHGRGMRTAAASKLD
jgi:hypothetical protein